MKKLIGLAFQPGGELMLSAHGNGTFALLDARSGAVTASCGDGRRVRDNTFALSACGNFVIQCRWQEINIREISSNTVVWTHPGNVRRVLPLNDGHEWILFQDQELQVWRWPFSQAPEKTMSLSSPLVGIPSVSGTLMACTSYKEVSVLDLLEGRCVFSVPLGQLGGAHWSHDGSLIVVKSRPSCLERYDRGGALIRSVSAPGLSLYGHAFSRATDDVVLVYHEGIVLLRNFRQLLDTVTELPLPWTPREPRAYDSEYRAFIPQEPAESTVVEAATPQELAVALEKFRRPAWQPVLRAERGPIDGSKFGGVPWLATTEDWPRCGQCDSRMDLFLQLSSAHLPADCAPPFEGLLQVFVCTHTTFNAGLCNSAVPFSNAASVRILSHPGGMPRYTELPDADLFDEQRLVGWVRHDDLPHFDELELAGVTLGEHARNLQIDRKFPFPVSGDKLLGYADWEQGVELVGCPRCGEAMRILFQIDSCCGVPVMLADGGRGWVSQCSQHPDVVTFSWTCG